MNRDRLPADRGIGQRTFVATVNPFRPPPATRTSSGAPSRMGTDHDRTIDTFELVDRQPGKVRQENTDAFEIT